MQISTVEITRDEVQRDYPMVAGMLEWIRWLAEQDDQFPLTAGQIAVFYEEHVRKGRYPVESQALLPPTIIKLAGYCPPFSLVTALASCPFAGVPDVVSSGIDVACWLLIVASFAR